ncbi:MAG: VanZ family protein [Flavobacterium sp.]|nr:VanZ family protein [Flavobacterium sp.]
MKITKHLSERNFIFLALLWTLGVTIGSLVSLNNMPAVSIPGNDKTAHFLFYYVFFILWYFGLTKKCNTNYFSVILAIITLCYGICMEFLQANYTANRHADPFDVVANAAGMLAGFVTVYLIKKNYT